MTSFYTASVLLVFISQAVSFQPLGRQALQNEQPTCQDNLRMSNFNAKKKFLKRFFHFSYDNDKVTYLAKENAAEIHSILVVPTSRVSKTVVEQNLYKIECPSTVPIRVGAVHKFSVHRPLYGTSKCSAVYFMVTLKNGQTQFMRDIVCSMASAVTKALTYQVAYSLLGVPCNATAIDEESARCCRLEKFSKTDFKLCRLRTWHRFYDGKCARFTKGTYQFLNKKEGDACCHLEGAERYNCAMIMFEKFRV